MKSIFLACVGATALLAGCNTTTTPQNVVSFAAFTGAGSALTAADLNTLSPQIDALDDAIDANTIIAPTVAPSGEVDFYGLVAYESGETESNGLDEVYIIGSLTITADLVGGAVTAEASDFAEYDAADPNNLVASTTI